MSGLVDRIQRALADSISRDDVVDPMQELGALLREVGLDPAAGGGAVNFAGRDPIVASPLPFATMAAVALMAKSISVAALWRFRGGVRTCPWTSDRLCIACVRAMTASGSC
jgi:hypothetical protein